MTIKIGLLFSMTGTMAVTEKGQYQAALLAINEINENGGILGKKLIPVLRDTCSSPLIAAKETEKLLSQNINLFVGLYTSASRKSLLSVLEKQDGLLFYPTHYEGGEQHPNVVYCGTTPNQVLLDYIPWLIHNLGKKIYLIGSDYIYPREMNKLIRNLVEKNGGIIVEESYPSLGEKKFLKEINTIKNTQVDVIFSTLVGESAVSLYQEHYNANLKMPIASTITAETEIHALNKEYMIGHYSCFPYFNTIDSKENSRFKEQFKAAYGTDIISSAMENAYNSIYLLAKALDTAQDDSTSAVKKHLPGLTLQAPQGEIIVDESNQHLCLNSRIGQVDQNGLFKVVWQSKRPINPLPFSLQSNTDPNKRNLEDSLVKNASLIHDLKNKTHFFPYPLFFFNKDGVLLDVFDAELENFLINLQFPIGMSTWTSKFLASSGINKALQEKEIAYSIGADHTSPTLKNYVSLGIPIKSNTKFYGILGCIFKESAHFSIESFLKQIEPLTVIIQQTVELLEASKDFTFTYEILLDISNQLDKALIVKYGKKILFKNAKAEELLNDKNEITQRIIQENFDHITYKTNKKKLDNHSLSTFEIEILPVHHYRYIYIQKNEGKIKNTSKPATYKTLRFRDIIGENSLFLDSISQATIASKNTANILILGESGTGKEVFARAIHNESERKDKPFIAINCAAINENLITSELFGYVEGAFTGAKKGGNIGKFEQANGGTLFLDEIGDMSLNLQATLLRVLQEKEIVRVGGNTTIPINVRIIAATNKDLPKEIAYNGSFREDLYYRLNVFTIELPSLKERQEDIYDLANHFLEDITTKENGPIKTLSTEAANCLNHYTWPGNIRELKNVIERAYYISDTSMIINSQDLPRNILSNPVQKSKSPSINLKNLKEVQQKEEQEKILQTLIKFKGNISKSAQHLGISRNTLYKKIKVYNFT